MTLSQLYLSYLQLKQLILEKLEITQSIELLKEAPIYLKDDAGNTDAKFYLDANDDLIINTPNTSIKLLASGSLMMAFYGSYMVMSAFLSMQANKIANIDFLEMNSHSTGYAYTAPAYGWNSDYDLPVSKSATYGERAFTPLAEYHDDGYVVFSDHFTGNALANKWTTTVTSTGAVAIIDGQGGIVELSTGATSGSTAVLYTGKKQFDMDNELLAKVIVSISDVSECDFYFKIDDGAAHYAMVHVDNGSIFLKTKDGTTENPVDSTKTLADATETEFELWYDATNVKYILKQDGTDIAESATNLPGNNNGYLEAYLINTSATDVNATIDYIKALQAR